MRIEVPDGILLEAGVSGAIAILSLLPLAVILSAEERLEAKVCLADPVTPARQQERNRIVIASIFERMGIAIWWQNCAEQEDISIRVLPQAPPDTRETTMAFTRLGPRKIVVFADRIRQSVSRSHPSVRNLAFAYVIAHELAHVMQGVARHSEDGIMKAQWTGDDFTAMLFHRLAFSEIDTRLIRQSFVIRDGEAVR